MGKEAGEIRKSNLGKTGEGESQVRREGTDDKIGEGTDGKIGRPPNEGGYHWLPVSSTYIRRKVVVSQDP